jgi:O-acetyl-ADP-ribose deacetylase (regulator of RNase III)
MNLIKGDLIQLAITGRFDVIVHGCNCFCTMGAGIAAMISENFPEALQADLKTPMGDRQKLGHYSHAKIKRRGNIFTVVNAYTQYNYSGPGQLVDYLGVKQVFSSIKQAFCGSKIGYPKIGAGLAKGNWDVISSIIDTALEGEDHTLVIYDP